MNAAVEDAIQDLANIDTVQDSQMVTGDSWSLHSFPSSLQQNMGLVEIEPVQLKCNWNEVSENE